MNTDELIRVAQTVYGEARNQDIEGQIAVAWVIKNRTMDRRWPNSPAAVAMQRKQFSCWNRGDPNNYVMLKVDLNKPLFLQIVSVVAAVFSGMHQDPTIGANHYHTKSVNPFWADRSKIKAEIGDHVFYRL